MTCPEVEKLKHACIDRELDIVHSAEIDRHLSGCAACSRSYENLRALSSALKAADLYASAPVGLKARISNAIAAEQDAAGSTGHSKISRPGARASSLWQYWLRSLLPLTGTAMLGFLLAMWVTGPSAESRLDQEVTASHVRSLMANHLTDVASSDQHTVKPWFDGKLDFAPPVKDLAAQGFPLTGGRLDYLQERSVVALVYARNKHVINLFIWPSSPKAGTAGPRDTMRQGYNLIQWTDSGMNFCAISDLNRAELHEFVELQRGP